SNVMLWIACAGGTAFMLGVIALVCFLVFPWEKIVVYVVTLAITVPISTAFLVASMFIASSILGGLDFGEPKIAIPKAAMLIVLVNLCGLIPVARFFLPALVWIFGLMLLFDLDMFEALFLGFVNWVLNFLVSLLLLTVLLQALLKGNIELPS